MQTAIGQVLRRRIRWLMGCQIVPISPVFNPKFEALEVQWRNSGGVSASTSRV
jgi:hypothetical protein